MLCNSDLTLHEVTFLTTLARHKNIVFLESVLTQFPTVLGENCVVILFYSFTLLTKILMHNILSR